MQEEWTYDDIMRAAAILDMYSAVDMARDAMDKTEMEGKTREMENGSRKNMKG